MENYTIEIILHHALQMDVVHIVNVLFVPIYENNCVSCIIILGAEVFHKYVVDNRGPWRVDYVDVEILWPYQVENNRPQGKWLLYLTGVPTVDGRIIFCIVISFFPFNLLCNLSFVCMKCNYSHTN